MSATRHPLSRQSMDLQIEGVNEPTMTVISREALAQGCANSLKAIATRHPRVHCITNAVAMNYSANMLLAVGAIPSMSLAADEITDFVARADSLLINIGTLDEIRRQAIPVAIANASEANKPWLLDPVFINTSPNRLSYAQDLLAHKPAVIRGNADEINTLSGTTEHSPQTLAHEIGCIVAQTGNPDVITDGNRTITLANGHPLLARITAMGCALTALIGAFLAVEKDTLLATAQALLALGVAGETAAAQVAGPGSLQVILLDQLYQLNATILAEKIQLL